MILQMKARLGLVTALGLAGTLGGEEPPRGLFPPAATFEGRNLLLNGVGLCEWGFFQVDLYWGALYLERRSSDPAEIIASDQHKEIRLHFVRALTAKQLRMAWTAAVEANAGKDLPRHSDQLERLNGMMRDVAIGETLVVTIVPRRGLEVRFKKDLRGVIAGEDFSRLFVTLYLGEHAPTEDLKAGLLGVTTDK